MLKMRNFYLMSNAYNYSEVRERAEEKLRLLVAGLGYIGGSFIYSKASLPIGDVGEGEGGARAVFPPFGKFC